MRRILLFFLLIFTFELIFADQVDDIIKNTKTNVSLEDATALNIYTSVKLEVEKDYSYIYKVFYIKKILTYKGKKRYSDVKLRYFPEYQKIKIEKAYTIDLNHNRFDVPDNMIYDLDTRDAMLNPKYIKEKEIVLNFPHIEPGYYIVLEYSLQDTRKLKPNDIEHLMESNPYAYKKFELIYPQNLKVKTYYPKDKNVKFISKIENGKKYFSWTVKDMPLIKSEPNMPSYMVVGCPIIYTFYQSWQELAKEKLLKLKPKDVSDDIKIRALQITKSCKNDEEKFLKLYKFFAENYKLNDSYVWQIDFTPEDYHEIENNKYGSIKDIVALFLVYAESVGIKDIYPALILYDKNSFYDLQVKYPLSKEISDLAIYYRGNLYKPADQKMPYGYVYVDKANIIYGFEEPVLKKYKYSSENLVIYNYNYQLNEKENVLKANCIATGYYNRLYRNYFQNLTDKKLKIRFGSFLHLNNANLIEGPLFTNFDNLEKNIECKYTLKLYDFIIKQGNFKYFKIKIPAIDIDVSKKIREYDYVNGRTYHFIDNIVISLNKKNKLIYPEKKINYTFKIGKQKAFFKYKIKKRKYKYFIKVELYLPVMVIEANKYNDFREFILSIKNPLNNMIFIKEQE